MHNQVTPTVPVTLRERLRAEGHEWVIDQKLGELSREDYSDNSWVIGLTNHLVWQIFQWNIPFTRSEVKMLIYDYTATKLNLDLDGRTKLFPPNRAQEIQRGKTVTTELHGNIAIDTWPDGTKSGRILVQHQVRFVREVSHEQLHPASHDHTVVFAVGDVADVARFVEGGAHVYTPSGDVVWVSNLTVVRI